MEDVSAYGVNMPEVVDQTEEKRLLAASIDPVRDADIFLWVKKDHPDRSQTLRDAVRWWIALSPDVRDILAGEQGREIVQQAITFLPGIHSMVTEILRKTNTLDDLS